MKEFKSERDRDPESPYYSALKSHIDKAIQSLQATDSNPHWDLIVHGVIRQLQDVLWGKK